LKNNGVLIYDKASNTKKLDAIPSIEEPLRED